jgi:hypothetical protein
VVAPSEGLKTVLENSANKRIISCSYYESFFSFFEVFLLYDEHLFSVLGISFEPWESPYFLLLIFISAANGLLKGFAGGFAGER